MAEPQCFGLGNENAAHMLWQNVTDHCQQFGLAGFFQFLFKLIGLVEIIGNGMLVAVGDEHQGIDAGLDGFIDRILDQRLIDNRKHFLGHRLGGWQKPGAEPGDRKYRFLHLECH